MSRIPENKGPTWGKNTPTPTGPDFEKEVLGLLPAMRRFAHSLSVGADGEDLLQDTVERAITRRDQWRGGSLRSWLCSIMVNLHKSRHRRARIVPMLDLESIDKDAVQTHDPATIERIRLKRALDGLETEFRTVLMLVVIEGYRYEDVATMLDIPIGTVMSRLSRARRRLANELREDNVITLRSPGP